MPRPIQNVDFGVWDAVFQNRGIGYSLEPVHGTGDDAGRAFDLAQAGGKVHVQKTFAQADDRGVIQKRIPFARILQ